jgi:hypothetical protein
MHTETFTVATYTLANLRPMAEGEMGGHTDNPEEEKERDKARCQDRDHRINYAAQRAHGHPGQHPIYYKSRATETGASIISKRQ